MQIKNMSKEELETLDLDYGVKVLNHRNNTLYRMGINPGYIITEINAIQTIFGYFMNSFIY